MNAEIQAVLDGKLEGCVVCGDCLEVLPTLPDGCVDLILTDPPYNLKKDYGGTTTDNLPEDIYWARVQAWVGEWYHVLGNGYCYVSHSDKGVYKLKPCMESSGFTYIQTLIWWGRNGYSMQLHRRSWSYRHEPILFCMKGNPENLSAGEEGDWYTSVIEAPRPQSNFAEGRCHPTQKPLLLMWRLLKRTPGEIVLDPFCGSGTSLLAAKILNRRYIGIDISPQYVAISKERLTAVDTGVSVREQRLGQLALFPVSQESK